MFLKSIRMLVADVIFKKLERQKLMKIVLENY
ncbi:hypothetical protein H4V97_002870 [Flavobacterium sp. CG_23.5]|nr:hypothetical protein [Flavobacterium sp. CG_23.5]